jgi:hypothetical protein
MSFDTLFIVLLLIMVLIWHLGDWDDHDGTAA